MPVTMNWHSVRSDYLIGKQSQVRFPLNTNVCISSPYILLSWFSVSDSGALFYLFRDMLFEK